MKRVLSVACLAVLVFAIAVSSAFAAGHVYSDRFVPRQGGFTAGSRALLSANSIAPEDSGVTMQSLGSFKPLDMVGSSELPYPTATGVVDASGAAHGIYWLYLEAGTQIDFHLDATPGSLASVQLFAPDAIDVNTSQPLFRDVSHSFPTTDTFNATSSGYYFVDVYTETGVSSYSLSYEIWQTANDDIPGTPMTASPMVRWSDADWNWDNVNSAPLRAGDRLALTLTVCPLTGSRSGFDLDLFLFGPAAVSVTPHSDSNPGYIADSAYLGNDEYLTFTAPTTSTYYVDSATYGGAGYDYLTWKVTPARPSIARTPSSARLAYTRKRGVAKFKLSARFTNGRGLQVGGSRVYLQSSSNGKKWGNTYSFTTNSNGSASRSFAAKKKGVKYYRWAIKNVAGKYSYSGSQKVTVR